MKNVNHKPCIFPIDIDLVYMLKRTNMRVAHVFLTLVCQWQVFMAFGIFNHFYTKPMPSLHNQEYNVSNIPCCPFRCLDFQQLHVSFLSMDIFSYSKIVKGGAHHVAHRPFQRMQKGVPDFFCKNCVLLQTISSRMQQTCTMRQKLGALVLTIVFCLSNAGQGSILPVQLVQQFLEQ